MGLANDDEGYAQEEKEEDAKSNQISCHCLFNEKTDFENLIQLINDGCHGDQF
jgi:hypothetical protein